MFNLLPNLSKTNLNIAKYGPDAAMFIGAGAIAGGFILGCVRSYKKTPKIIEEHNKNLAEVKETPEAADYSAKVKKVYFHTGWELFKTYAPAVGLTALGLGAMFGSHKELKNRNASLVAAYAALEGAYSEYKRRVKEKLGEEEERHLRYGEEQETVEVVTVDENGKEHKHKEKVWVTDAEKLSGCSPYAKIFDETCMEWTKDPEYNLMFLKKTEAYFNQRLKTRGYVFLNEVYEALDIMPTLAGQSVGWIYDSRDKDGDKYIDFGIYNPYNVGNRRFVNGLERCVWLDFNVDGRISQKLIEYGYISKS